MRTLDKKEKARMHERTGIPFSKKDILQYDEKRSAYVHNGTCIAYLIDEMLIPALASRATLWPHPCVTIDMPAVPYITNGADLLRPGIVAMDEFNVGDIVAIIDERNKVVIAYMRAFVSCEDARGMEKGKVARNLHWVGDSRWTS